MTKETDMSEPRRIRIKDAKFVTQDGRRIEAGEFVVLSDNTGPQMVFGLDDLPSKTWIMSNVEIVCVDGKYYLARKAGED